MKILLALLAASACARPPTYPMPADPLEARAAYVDSNCGDAPWSYDDPWQVEKSAAAVIVDDRVALTASHVVRCPDLPAVHITLSTGEVRLAHVTEDDGLVARLEPVSAEGWGLGMPLAEVMIAPWRGPVCEAMPRAERCGDVTATGGRLFTFEAPGKQGHSGAGVWDGEWLVGITQGIDEDGSTVASEL